MRNLMIIIFIFILSLACNLPFSPAQKTVDPNEIATVVARTLTSRPIIPQSTHQIDSESSTLPKEEITITPLPTTTSTQTQVPTYTTTPEGGLKSYLGSPDGIITFNTGNEGFFVDDDEYTIINVENSALVIKSTLKTVGWHGWSMQYKKLEDFYLEATIKSRLCSGRDEYGIVYRAPNYSSGYFLGLTCDGKFGLLSLTDKFRPIMDWRASPDINAGSDKINLLGVLAKGNRYQLYINDRLQAEIEDSIFLDPGTFGAFIAAYQTPGFTIEIDEFNYWVIQ